MTKFEFKGPLLRQGNRYFIKVPFHVWEECGQKGLIPVKVSMENCSFECRLVPKGAGIYYIPVTKDIVKKIEEDAEIHVSFEVIGGLTRINHDSPYSLENPIRKIDCIERVTYPKDGYCGQICMAMLTGLSVETMIDVMQAKAWQCSFSKIIETLDYFGILHDERMTYTRGKETILPVCCIVNVKAEPKNHLVLYYKGNFYDTGDVNADNIIGYLGITVESVWTGQTK